MLAMLMATLVVAAVVALRKLSALGEVIAGDEVLRKRLGYAARRQTRTDKDAEDLLQEAIVRALDAEARGDWPGKDALPAYALVSRTMFNLAGNRRKHLRKFRGVPLDEEVAASAGPTPEEAVRERQEHAHRRSVIDVLRERLAKDPIPLQMLDWADRGVTVHAELADKIGCSLDDIRNAVRRLRGHAAAVKNAMAAQGAAP